MLSFYLFLELCNDLFIIYYICDVEHRKEKQKNVC